MELTDAVNGFVDANKPWELAKDEAKRDALHAACSVSLEAFRLPTIYLKPVVPAIGRWRGALPEHRAAGLARHRQRTCRRPTVRCSRRPT